MTEIYISLGYNCDPYDKIIFIFKKYNKDIEIIEI